MYVRLRTEVIMILLFLGLGRPALAGLAEDQYAVAADHYTHARWELAVDEFTVFLRQYPDDQRRVGTVLSGRVARSAQKIRSGA